MIEQYYVLQCRTATCMGELSQEKGDAGEIHKQGKEDLEEIHEECAQARNSRVEQKQN